MVCPNCGSNEVIAVQGENFCISCGQLVPKPAPAPAAVSTDGLPDGVQILPVASAAPAPKTKRKPGRPKAGKLDVPAAATERIAAETPPLVVQREHLEASDVSQPQDAPPAPAPKPIHDIAPPPAHHKPKAAPVPAIVHHAAIAYGSILSASFGGRFSHGRAMFAFVPAVLLGLIATVSGLVLASSAPNKLVSVTLNAGWAVWGELIIVGIIYYLVRSLTHAAIIFGSARLDDHRPLAADRWLPVAADSQSRRSGLDLLALIALGGLAALIVGLLRVGGQTWPVPEIVQLIGLMIAYSALLYLAVAIAITVSLGHVAVTLAHVKIIDAAKLSWRLFSAHFELAGARITALAVELVVLVAVIVGAGGWLVITPSGWQPVVIIVLGLVISVAGAFAGAGTAIWWGTAYRALVRADHPAGFSRLLATSTPKTPRRGPVVAMGITIVALSVLAAAWPWLMH